ncbi:MAG: protease modulator HflC [Deltaproteobacteria bacterium]|nr:protease modulator HflC [Deltaproteobacteria bacterium]PIX82251.1 MAG: protease modulator HflC [Nitrospirae bacterium CG_4_10_14_3_um_filter_70_108]PJB95839.1 MAG: protease modulator HflC [Nitrospirae bacterium CG_4_9_14_0_8_um_filter_70_14]HBB41674.1 protease modulator HflC [Pseudomonadota bacterium]NCP96270.1 protease modulator HflC [Deltaproteobacteria bacterium]
MKRSNLLLPMVAVALLAVSQLFFIVDETQVALVTELGKFKRSVEEPGFHFKLPFVEQVQRYDGRLLNYDASPAEILTRDKKNLVIDNYARWRIADPLRFYQRVGTVAGAQSRLDDIIFSEMRQELAVHDQSEIIDVHREAIMNTVSERSAKKAEEYGIELIDVRIKRADLPREVEESVYARMASERARIAKRYRSEGAEEAAKIRATSDKERTILLAEASRDAEETRGRGDAEAAGLYAAAYEQDPDFYDFVRSLEAYRQVLAGDTTTVLDAHSPLLRFLESEGDPSTPHGR